MVLCPTSFFCYYNYWAWLTTFKYLNKCVVNIWAASYFFFSHKIVSYFHQGYLLLYLLPNLGYWGFGHNIEIFQ